MVGRCILAKIPQLEKYMRRLYAIPTKTRQGQWRSAENKTKRARADTFRNIQLMGVVQTMQTPKTYIVSHCMLAGIAQFMN